jgi:hypothetical protein
MNARMLVLIGVALQAVAAPVPAQTVCRPNTLGRGSCIGYTPPPVPRPASPLESSGAGLGGVIDRPGSASKAPGLVPAGRTNSFGDVLVPAPGNTGALRPGPRCRTDTLGNLRCP